MIPAINVGKYTNFPSIRLNAGGNPPFLNEPSPGLHGNNIRANYPRQQYKVLKMLLLHHSERWAG